MRKKDPFLLKNLVFIDNTNNRNEAGKAVGAIIAKGDKLYCGMTFTYPSGLPTINDGSEINQIIDSLSYFDTVGDKLPLRFCRKFLRKNLESMLLEI